MTECRPNDIFNIYKSLPEVAKKIFGSVHSRRLAKIILESFYNLIYFLCQL